MAGTPQEFKTPTGRLVQGSFFKGSTTNKKGEPLVVKNGPNAGQPYTNYYVGIAIPKTDPGWEAVWAIINQTAQRDWPNLFQNGQCIRHDFAWKYTDGDSTQHDKNGNRPCDKPGFPGNHILGFSSIIVNGNSPKPVYKFDNGTYVTLTEPESVKKGHFVQVSGSVVGNDTSDNPGVYLNLHGALFVAYGEEILTGPSAEFMFGDAPSVALPPGASATPLAPSTPPPAGMIPQPTGAPTIPAGGDAPVAPIAPVAPTIQPSPGFLKPPSVYIASDGNKYTEEQLVGFGFTKDQILALPKA